MIDPELRPYLAMWDKAWADLPPRATAQDRRAILNRLADAARKPLPAGIASEVHHIANGDRPVRVVIFRPVSPVPTPCLIYMHGGAWMQGSPETHDEITVGIAAAARYTVVSVDYALAPEQPFPAAVRDCEAVVRWVFAQAPALNIRADAISVGGDSAGGNLAAVLCLAFRGTEQNLRGQLLFYPGVDCDFTRASFAENADGPIIKTAAMDATLAQYAPNRADWTDWRVSPLRAADHSRLPPAFIAVAEHDPLRDDGLAYAAKLTASGAPVELHRGRGLIHGYLRAMSYSAAVREAFAAACGWLDRLAADAPAATARR
jgi:acetyl esterase